MAESIHPLFATRGVPGTHDLALLNEAISALRQSGPGGAVHLPVFDKVLDNRTELVHWRQVSAPVQLIFLEGWSVADGYADLFGELEALLLLQAPSFDAVFEWRWQQEQRLSKQFQKDHPDQRDPTMSRSEVSDFVLHYQRLTEHALKTLPDRADFVWELATDRSVERMWLTEVAA